MHNLDQLNDACFPQSFLAPNQFDPCSIPIQSGSGIEIDNASARKSQKAGREKLRRDRLNEQFLELGKVLDPDRPKNDKGSILTDTIQVVTDMTAQVTRLKAEFATLTEESRELTQEKNDLREEKVALKSDIESLNSQYQQRVRATYPWGAMDHSMVMHPPQYPMHVPFQMPMPTGPIPMPMPPNMQPFPYFGAQTHGVIPNPCSNYVPCMNNNPTVEQQSVQQGGKRNVATKRGVRDELSNCQGEIDGKKGAASNDVMTELELKTPGSARNEDASSPQRKSRKVMRKGNDLTKLSSCSSKCSSSNTAQNSSSSSVVGGGKVDDTETPNI